MINRFLASFPPILQTMRLHNGVACAALMFAGRSSSENLWSTSNLGAALALVLLCSAANIVNDIIDLTADRINRPQRALAAGRISAHSAKIWSICCLLTGILIGVSAKPGWIGWWVFWSFSGPGYSLFAKGKGWFAPVWTAVVIASCWLAGTGLSNITGSSGLIFLIATYFLVFREIVKTVADVPGDLAAGYQTVAGSFPGNRVGVLVFSIPLFILLAINLIVSNSWPEFALLAGMVVLLGVSMSFVGDNGKRRHLPGSFLKAIGFMALVFLLTRSA